VFSDDRDKIRCSAMDPDGFCQFCEGRCFWNVHKNVSWKIIREELIEEITGEELVKKHANEKDKKHTLSE